jgi:hypothetical protein
VTTPEPSPELPAEWQYCMDVLEAMRPGLVTEEPS